MNWPGGAHVVRVLVASVALLLPAGVLSAAVVEPPASTPAPAGRAESAQPAAPADTTTTSTTAAVVPTASPSSTVATTATTRRPTNATTATTAKAPTATTLTPTRPTRPPIQTIPTTPRVRPATFWEANRNGVSARVRIEPASPNAGQPVRFVVDVSSAEDCCLIFVSFGEGTATATNLTEVCGGAEPLGPGAGTYETTHTYGAPGAYRANFSIEAGGPCPGSAPPGGRAGAFDVSIQACFAVGPAPAGQEGCRP